MTQVNQDLTPTNLMLWYSTQERKADVKLQLCRKTGLSEYYVTKWLKGYAVPKKESHIKALEEVAKMPRTKLFKLVE